MLDLKKSALRKVGRNFGHFLSTKIFAGFFSPETQKGKIEYRESKENKPYLDIKLASKNKIKSKHNSQFQV